MNFTYMRGNHGIRISRQSEKDDAYEIFVVFFFSGKLLK